MHDHCLELDIIWHYCSDQPYMLEIGQLMAASLDTEFKFESMVNMQNNLDRNYRKCLVDARKLSALIRSRIDQFNEIYHNSYQIGDFDESILKEILEEGHMELVREIISMRTKYQELHRQLDQCRLSVMKRDLDDGKELNDHIKQWWGNRY